MINQVTAKKYELPALLAGSRLLFLHRGIGRAPEQEADRKYSRITNCFPRGQSTVPVQDGGYRDIAWPPA
jgi:hypothetical protein